MRFKYNIRSNFCQGIVRKITKYFVLKTVYLVQEQFILCHPSYNTFFFQLPRKYQS